MSSTAALKKNKTYWYTGITALGVGVAGLGWYLYRAGGESKQKQSDAKVSSQLKSESPKIDNTLSRAESDLKKAASDAEAYAKSASQKASQKVDEIEKKVEAEAPKAKSGYLSWFGGK
ncbi:hypothetical protein F4779DRAFT_84796 [Xylariaceae sp. FL0662B]|nr:hypothetical protein F4779DRAFT_84796 [Xylariaceae sp. FL0662B]